MTTVTKYQAEEWHLPWKASPTLWGCVWGWRTQHPFHTLRKKSWLWSLMETLSLLNPKNPESEFSFQGRCPDIWTQLTPRRAFHQGSWQDQPREVPGWGHCSWLILKTHRKLWLLQQTQREKVEGRGKKKNRAWKFPPHWASHGPWALAPRVPTKCNG